MVLLILIRIAFITLYERHGLSLSQNRLGPFKVSYYGVFQAVFDGLKLFKKDLFYPLFSFKYFFFVLPVFSFILILIQ
jgi:NADH:ubiquinone oxidoreductase subunit H